MIRMLMTAAAVLTATAISVPRFAPPQGAAQEQLGSVHFKTSCNETAPRRFDRAMRYQHSFWYNVSQEIFEETLKADPDCAIAYWGIALSLLHNPHSPPPPENLPQGLAGLQKGKAIGAKSERERDYIDALLVYYTDHESSTIAPGLRAISRRSRGSRSATRMTTRPRSPTPSPSTLRLRLPTRPTPISSRPRRSSSRSCGAFGTIPASPIT